MVSIWSDIWTIVRSFDPVRLHPVVERILAIYRVSHSRRELTPLILAMHVARVDVACGMRDHLNVATVAFGRPDRVLENLLVLLDSVSNGCDAMGTTVPGVCCPLSFFVE